jgi:hypothetical protein
VDEAEQTVRRILTAGAPVDVSWSSRAARVEFLELLTAVTKGAISGLATNLDTNGRHRDQWLHRIGPDDPRPQLRLKPPDLMPLGGFSRRDSAGDGVDSDRRPAPFARCNRAQTSVSSGRPPGDVQSPARTDTQAPQIAT